MNMDSFVVTIGEFLHMNGARARFDANRTNYVIPKYQREYKWSDERVVALISDIKNRDKFIGNIILNKVEDHYEIVDGQQRITTIILILIALFNRNKHPRNQIQTEEQKTLLGYLTKTGKFILENESIGEYVLINETEIQLQIEKDEDIYYQKETFNHLFCLINHILFEDNSTKIEESELLSFQKKVLDCQVLVLIGEPDGRQQDSIEEVFLDINFKSQLLDVANIFKGYCFKNYSATSHDELKQQWTNIRKYTKQFERSFGYEENRETCEYLYLYLLSVPGSYKIPANLSPGGVHFLESKNHTQTKELLEDMVDYGNHIIDFFNNLSNDNYIFEDICYDAKSHENDTNRIKSLRSMALSVIESKEAQYYKLPLFMLLHFLLKDDMLSSTLDFISLKALITNMYIYAFLFTSSGKSKNKTLIAYDVLEKIHNRNSDTIKDVLSDLKSIRRNFLEDFGLFRNFNTAKGYSVYSIMDHYTANDNFIEQIYSFKSGYTPEHFLIHNNSIMEVQWKDGDNSCKFGLKDLLGKPDGRTYKGTSYKKQTINYLILPKELNETIKSDDIVSKIDAIKGYYNRPGTTIPKHVELFIHHIEGMPAYIKLKNQKGTHATQEDIENEYKEFINIYFSDENQASLYRSLENKFKSSFHNH